MSIWVFDTPPAVFIRIRKTGSTSIVRGIFKGRGVAHTVTGSSFPPEWKSRFVFAFVRNPFDRLVSSLEMFQTYPVKSEQDASIRSGLGLHDVMDVIEDDTIPIAGETYVSKLRQHAIQMTHGTYFLNEADFIGRFERFEKDCRHVYRQLGMEEPEIIPHRRNTPPRDYRSYFDKSTRSRAEQIFAEDLERFDYNF
ncbi:sulfotransferase family 2 domain-containing protein [uncultured Roseobacter sp.]|uniref:sulfotransferase family 2 domain-containing protein n=1 Tax=uncultured Roseobacter sp. TaxID=114847 RepID=UPI00260AB12D|nr:sulfotransferase family 2 domain-containing protein [uncultured Roseobacter sp.]